MSQAQSCLLSSRPGQAVQKQRSRAPYKNPKLHYRSTKRGGERRVLLQEHSDEEFVKFPERRLGDLGQRKMLRLCICSSCVSQVSLALHPKLLQFFISLSLSPAHQANQDVTQLSKVSTYTVQKKMCQKDSLHLSFSFLILISPPGTIWRGDCCFCTPWLRAFPPPLSTWKHAEPP